MQARPSLVPSDRPETPEDGQSWGVEHFQLALDAAHMGTWDWDITSDRVAWSPSVEEIFGLPKGAFAGTLQAYGALLHPDDRDRVLGTIQATLAGQHSEYTLEHRILWPDASVHWLECKGRIYRDAQGNAQRLIGTVVDISARKHTEEALRRVEDIFRAVVEDQTEMIVRWRPDGTRTFVNEAYCRTFGGTQEQMIGTSFFPLVAEPFRAAVLERIAALTPDSPVSKAVHQSFLPDGSICWQEWTDRALFDEHGKVVALQSVGRDVTGSVESARSLAASRELLRQFIIHTPAAVAMLDNDMRYVEVSNRWRVDYQLGDMELRGRSHYEVFPKVSDEQRAVHKRVLSGAVERCNEDAFFRPDGCIEWLEWEIRPWYHADSSIGGLIMFSQVVTEKKRVAEALRTSEERFRSALEHSPIGMAIVSPDGRFLEVNPALCRIIGYTREELLARDFASITHPDDLNRDLSALKNMLDAQFNSFAAEKRYLHKQGHSVWVQLNSSLVRHADGTPRYFISQIQDISERKAAEAALEQLRHVQKLDSVGRLAGGIAHDFNNLLTVILGQLELVRLSIARKLDPISHIEAAADAGRSAAALTRQLLLFAHKQPASPSALDVNEVVQRTHRMLERVMSEEIALVVRLDPTLPRVWMDQGQLEQVLLNLAVNAKDAMPAGGMLTISTQMVNALPKSALMSPAADRRPYARISVEDTGIGMDHSVLAHIFEPFFTTKGAGKGTGIGLATVHGVIQSAGGYIDVASTLNQGTRFDIYLPSTELKEARSVGSREAVLGRDELVALVEDQAAVRAVAYTQLTLLGYRVMAFASAEEALAGLEHDLQRVDVLLTDVVMSGLHGPAMVDILRSRRPSLRVVYMSGYTDEIVMSRGVGTQLSGLLRKPFTLEELAHALRSALSAEQA